MRVRDHRVRTRGDRERTPAPADGVRADPAGMPPPRTRPRTDPTGAPPDGTGSGRIRRGSGPIEPWSGPIQPGSGPTRRDYRTPERVPDSSAARAARSDRLGGDPDRLG